MRSVLVLSMLLCSISLVAHGAPASDPLPGRMPGLRLPPRMETPVGPVKVGSWVEFSVRDLKQEGRVRLRWALVERGADGQWWELTFRMPRQQPLRIKALSQGEGSSPDRVRRVILQTGTSPPLELPLKQGQKLMDMYLRPGAAVKVQELGRVQVTTAAGVFQTQHRRWIDHQGQPVEEWTSPAAGIWGLVRFKNPRFEMELIGQGTGAASGIRGTPTRWHIPGL